MNNGAIDFFLGSGTSVQAGIPTGGGLVWHFKRDIYCSETETSVDKFKDLSSQHTRETLQKYFDNQGSHPPLYGVSEYSHYFELCYATSIAREKFIQNVVRDVLPSMGHLCLGELVIQNKIQCIWTTNFDELVEVGIQTIRPEYSYKVFSTANKTSQTFAGFDDFSQIIKLHGDYRYDKIKNTSFELQSLEQTMNQQFENRLKGKGLIVLGYSGSDESVMSALEKNIECTDFLPYGLTWLMPHDVQLNERVQSLMEKACAINDSSCIVEIQGFDEFLYGCYQIQNYQNACIDNRWRNFSTRKKDFSFSALQIDSFIKINAFAAYEYPPCYAFDTDVKSWANLKDLVGESDIIAALYSNRIFCFCDESSIRPIFNNHILSDIIKENIPEKFLYMNNSVYIGMLYELIKKTITNDNKIVCFGKNQYFDSTTKKLSGRNYKYDAVELYLSFIDGKLYLNIMPSFFFENRSGSLLDKEEKQRLTNVEMSGLFNKQYNEKIKLWYKNLLNDGKICFEYKSFKISFWPMYLNSGDPERCLDQQWPRAHSYKYLEPEMCFSATDSSCKGINQLKGLVRYSPLDYSYSRIKNIRPAIRISIISPKQTIEQILHHLNKLNLRCATITEDGFTPLYNGFESVYKRGLSVPLASNTLMCSLYDEDAALRLSTENFVQLIKNQVDYFACNKPDFDVLIIYIPTKFSKFRESSVPTNDFNLHDAIKLYSTDKGIRTQFIEEKSVRDQNTCKVMWALSTSIYAKATGVLWQPADMNEGTAFVGVSYAISKSKGICIGCSQLYDSSGTGVRLILRKIEDSRMFDRNPYMSSDEARSMMSQLREQYYLSDPTVKLNRIVIHKTTHFTPEEIKGFTQAFEGVDDIELLQIQEFSPWRAIRFCDKASQGAAPFPMKRGTVIQLSDDSFLVWTHGCVIHDELKGKLNYYKGGRGIPAPLLVKRFYGKASGDTVVNEILMLTKMNWNSGDCLYKLLPVTLDFAKTLSRMAKQNEAIYDRAYDFRYFM